MPEDATIEVDGADLPGRRAVRAWGQLLPARAAPQGVEALKKKRRSRVYRLAGVGPGGSAVIAKRCRRATAMVERTLYEDILPHLPVPAPRYHGFLEEGHSKYCWLFLEDVDGQEYSPTAEEHRVLAGRWLGLLHASTPPACAIGRLPERGPGYYLEHLRSARDIVRDNLTNPALGCDDPEVLGAIVRQCEVVASRWGQVDRYCDGMPRTLVHGDFLGKNVRIRATETGATFLAFDWEHTGWGIPAADLAQVPGHSVSPDIAAYWSAVRPSWPHLDLADIQRLAALGTILWLLVDINRASWNFTYGTVEKAMSYLRGYRPRLAGAIRAVGWGD